MIAYRFLRTPAARGTAPIVRLFHRWMKANDLALARLHPEDVDSFLQRPFRRPLAPRTRASYRCLLSKYLDWLHGKGQISFDPRCLGPSPNRLPPMAEQFIESVRAAPVVGALHRWMKGNIIGLLQLQPSHIDQFLQRLEEKPLARTTQRSYRSALWKYLDWLSGRGHLSFDPKCLPHRPTPLPQIAKQFLQSLTTLKESTCRHYRTHLQAFHRWLADEDVSLGQLDRLHITRWFRHLKDKGLHASTRLHAIICVRVYLRWLHEHGAVQTAGDELVRSTDQPKLPVYLPRPLPLEADHQLQLRLASAKCPYQQALLLMRNTGLRIGELIALEYDCVRTDHQGNRFLKVPLGKLDTERLVPIDDKTAKLIARLQRRGRRGRAWLLETPSGSKTRYEHYRPALLTACKGLDIAEPVTTHRLRHTYATALLGGGMSLVGVMKLLGHRDYRMTLRYTAITLETIGKEYFEALVQIEKKYSAATRLDKPADLDPAKLLLDIARWVRNKTADDPDQSRAALRLVKRIKRLRADLQTLSSQKQRRR